MFGPPSAAAFGGVLAEKRKLGFLSALEQLALPLDHLPTVLSVCWPELQTLSVLESLEGYKRFTGKAVLEAKQKGFLPKLQMLMWPSADVFSREARVLRQENIATLELDWCSETLIG